jgi:hypothetical protein
MSVCISILANQLEEVAGKLDNNKFKYKFLYDSDDKYKTIETYKLQLLPDCIMFSGLSSQMRAGRMKVGGKESDIAWRNLINDLFDEERQIAVVNDYWDNPYMVIVTPITFYDPTQRSGNNYTTLTDDQLNTLTYLLNEKFKSAEGMNVVTWEEYNMDMFVDEDPDNLRFKGQQQWIKNQAKKNYKQDLYKTFMETFRFRMIAYYTKLRDYNLDDIMRKLGELGYLDERFNNELYLYEEEARRLLAKRLCTISFKDDIELLIKEGIIDKNKITYNLNV